MAQSVELGEKGLVRCVGAESPMTAIITPAIHRRFYNRDDTSGGLRRYAVLFVSQMEKGEREMVALEPTDDGQRRRQVDIHVVRVRLQMEESKYGRYSRLCSTIKTPSRQTRSSMSSFVVNLVLAVVPRKRNSTQSKCRYLVESVNVTNLSPLSSQYNAQQLSRRIAPPLIVAAISDLQRWRQFCAEDSPSASSAASTHRLHFTSPNPICTRNQRRQPYRPPTTSTPPNNPPETSPP